MRVAPGVDALEPADGPLFVVVGVFDGLHLGHAYLLRHLVAQAATRTASPTVITFDHHPDEVLTGHAPPLLLDPDERIERLAAAGVAITVVQQFDTALRQTPYDAFVERIRGRSALAGFLMTPDAAFGYERGGTPATLTELGVRDGFDVVVVPPFTLDGRPVRSTEIRAAIGRGDLPAAEALLGRPVTLTGECGPDGRLTLSMPMALPPPGRYAGRVATNAVVVDISGGGVHVSGTVPAGRVTVEIATGEGGTAVG